MEDIHKNTIPLSDILTAAVVAYPPETPLPVALEAMRSRHISSVVVVDADGKPIGIFTERDAVSLLARGHLPEAVVLGGAMSHPVVAAKASLDYREAYQRMAEYDVRHLVVTADDGGLLGIVSEADFLHYLGEEYLVEVKTVAAAMERAVLALDASVSLREVLAAMHERHVDYAVVTQDDIPSGMLTERDVVHLALGGTDQTLPAGALMSPGIHAVSPHTPLPEVSARMADLGVRRLLVMEGDRIVGVVNRHDIVKALQGRYVEYLRATIARLRRAMGLGEAAIPEIKRQIAMGGLLDRIGDAVYIIDDCDGRILDVNQAAIDMLGYGRDEFMKLSVADFSSDIAAIGWEAFRQKPLPPDGLIETEHRRKSGEQVPVEIRIHKVDSADIVLRIAIVRDTSERQRTEEQLRLATQIFEHSGEAIMVTDAANRIVSVNHAFTETTGYTPSEVVGWTPSLLSSGRHDAAFFAEMWRTLAAQGSWRGEVWNRRKNGEVYPEWMGISTVRDRAGQVTHYVAIFSDISERKAAEERIEFLAQHDPLTGLPNRLLLRDRIEQAVAHAGRKLVKVGLLFIDLDRFKIINDSLGHPVGDRLLCEVAVRLRHCVRDVDTISRLGGDEFLIVLTDMHDTELVARLAEKIKLALSAAFEHDGEEVAISGSMGVSIYPDDGEDFDLLLKKAGTAMSHAKEEGRDTIRFYADHMNIDSRERLDMRSRLRRGVERQEFILHYQPLVDLTSGLIVGAEALVRWQSPDLGMVAPGRFIPLAEESGLIVPIGEWVLYEACREVKRWHDAGHTHLSIAVNLSAIQFRRGNVEEQVKQALAAAGANPEALELELTESILLQGADQVLETVQRLKNIGVRLSIDDFGTGYSSLSYLKRFAVDKLKIDQSFVRDLSTDADDAAIVRAVIQMAKSLNLVVLAEGVETLAIADDLRLFNCDYVQGFHFGRPVPAEEFRALIERQRLQIANAGLETGGREA